MTFFADVPQHADLAARLAPIRAHFLSTLGPRLDRLTVFLTTPAGDVPPPAATLRQLQEDAHKIRGVAPTLGFDALGHSAALADDLLDPWHNALADLPVSDAVRAALSDLRDHIATALAAGA